VDRLATAGTRFIDCNNLARTIIIAITPDATTANQAATPAIGSATIWEVPSASIMVMEKPLLCTRPA
jgi:hypothetical protein